MNFADAIMNAVAVLALGIGAFVGMLGFFGGGFSDDYSFGAKFGLLMLLCIVLMLALMFHGPIHFPEPAASSL